MTHAPNPDWPRLWPDFSTLCGFGGRLSGTDSEANARQWLLARIGEIPGATVTSQPIDYRGWLRHEGLISIVDQPGQSAAATALMLSPATPPGGLEAEVVDLGEGTAADFAAAGDLTGRIALVRHGYAFSPDHTHRSVKYHMARDKGAAAFLIANALTDGLVTGSSGNGEENDIPAAGIAEKTAAMLTAPNGAGVRARLELDTSWPAGQAANLIAEVPGETDEWVVLSAHLDGHDLGQSAIDNASGVVVALAVAEALAAIPGKLHRGLRLCLFNVEEWNLTGSKHYIDNLSPAERAAIMLNVNLDVVVGAEKLSALVSGFIALEPWLERLASKVGDNLAYHRPLVRNSDHYNFAEVGIPAFRLLAGFGEPQSNVRHLLTPGDTVDKVTPQELQRAATLVAEIVRAGCTEPDINFRREEDRQQ